mgnify:CR=1 FL=1
MIVLLREMRLSAIHLNKQAIMQGISPFKHIKSGSIMPLF